MQSAVYAQQPEDKTVLVAISNSSVIVIDRVLYTALKRLGYDPVIERMETKTAINSVDVGDKYILGAVSGMEEHGTNLIRVPEVVSASDCMVYVKEGSDVVINSWQDVRDLRIAYNSNQIYIENNLQQYCDNPLKFNNSEKAFEALQNNQADAVIILEFDYADNIVPKGIVKTKAVDTLAAYSYVNKEYAYLAPQLTAEYKEMRQDGTLDKIKNQQPIKDKEGKIVLHVSSYNTDMVWENQLIQGTKDSLKDHEEITYINVPLNTRRQQGADLNKDIARDYLCDELLEKIPDVLIVSDNNALNFVVSNYATLFVNVPIVFCGINQFHSSMLNGLDDYSTGVVECVSARETVEEMVKLYPNTKKVFMINDYSLSGQKIKDSIVEDLGGYKGNVSFEYNENLSISDLAKKIESLDKDTLVLLGTYFTDDNGDYYSEADVSQIIQAGSKNAFFTLYPGTFDLGVLGGKITSSYNHGSAAAKMALKVLYGTPPNEIPIIFSPNGINEWVFDYQVADQFYFNYNLFPKDSTIINKKPPIHESDPVLVVTVISIIILILIVAGILGVFSVVTRRRNTELIEIQKSLHTAEELLERDLIIKEIKNRLEKSIGSAPIGYVVTIDGIVIETNSYIDDMFGLKINQPVREVYLDPLEREDILKKFDEGRSARGRTVYLKTVTGEAHRFQLNYNTVEYANEIAFITWVVSVEEVEAQKDALSLAEKDLQKIVDTQPVPMIIIRKADIKIIYVNDYASSIFEFDELKEKADDKLAQIVDLFYANKHEYGDNVKFEFVYDISPETKKDLKIYASEINYKNDECIIFVCQNISAQKKESEHLLNAAKKEREANKMKSVFLANMSHEIRTPMNAILGFSQILISDKALDHKQKEFIHSINKSGEHLLTLINDVLEMSKIEAGAITYNPSNIDLYAMILEVKNMFMVRTKAKNISFVVEYDDLPRYIFSDESKLMQIMINLLGNAVKFTQSGGLSWILKCNNVEEQNTLIFEITDTGVGIEHDELEHIFEPFEQSESGKKNGGTGLGLAISRQLARFLGGDIYAKSEYGVGTTFRVELPVKIGDALSQAKAETVQNVVAIAEDKHPRILVVDDKEDNILVLRELLGPVGFIIREARDGREALDIFEKESLDLILMDMRMPVMDGYEASIRIRESEKHGDIPIIALTASAFEEDKQRVYDIGIDDFVRKPFQRKSLFNIIEKYLNIEYIYEEDTVEAIVAQDTDVNFDTVPAILLERLEEAVNMADFNEALEILDIMMEFITVGEYNLIKSLIDTFQYEKIAQILNLDLSSDR